MWNTFLSVIIPAFNEEDRIEAGLEKVVAFLKRRYDPSEIVVVDDGSSDRTFELAHQYVDRGHPAVRVIRNVRNMGKGYSVKNGVLNSSGKFVLFTDVDLSVPIEEAPKLLEPLIASDYDVVFGSRGLRESVIVVHQPKPRELSGRVFNFIVRWVSGLGFKDTQCGFKAFRREAANEVFAMQTIHGFGFDVEILYAAQKLGWRIKEVPVTWSHVEGTKVNVLSDPFRMLVDLFRIRLNDLNGKYKKIVSKARHEMSQGGSHITGHGRSQSGSY